MLDFLRGGKKYVLIYLVLLGLSHLFIRLIENPVIDKPNVKNNIQLNVVRADQTETGRQISIGYDDVYQGNEENPPVLLLLPGGPEGPEVFNNILPGLALHFRVLIPHLPGYNDDNINLPSYSFRTSSEYVQQFLNKLGVADAHVMGFGLGGASAIYLAQNHSQKVESLGLIASVGVQELQLLGSYRLNHAVHGMQLAAVWMFYNAIPHFGLFKAFDIDVSYTRRHYESDQRPLRSYLKQYNKPMLILHGRDDPLVPLVAAQEHHRIVPQSKIKIFDTDHDLLSTHSDSASEAIQAFVNRVEKGKAVTAASASLKRIEEAEKPFSNVEFAKFKGVSLLIIMLIIILSTFITEDLTCIGAGLLVARGLIGFWPAVLACFLGILIGDVGLYIAGRLLGRQAVKRAPFKWFLTEKDLEKSARWFRAKGPAILVAARFLPGSRMPAYFSAGVIRAGFYMFITYFILSGIIWTLLLVGVSELLGNRLIHYFTLYQDYAIWVLIGAITTIILLIKVIIPSFSYRGRRLLVSKYRKFIEWQYWWPAVIYAPSFCYIFYLGIKYRCLTLFTAANPALLDDKFTVFSRSEILDLFKSNSKVTVHSKIKYDHELKTMLDQVDVFMKSHSLSFPVVCQPDVSKRRELVKIEDRYELQDYFSKAKGDIFIREHMEGKEAEILYYRFPGKDKGAIYSMTLKGEITVTGDGRKTLEELILSDKKAIKYVDIFVQVFEDELYEVPKENEVRILSTFNTQKSFKIWDAGELVTDRLTDSIDKICSTVDGFYFGKLFIKAPDHQSLMAGNNLKVIELKGINSISSNIYDDDYSFLEGQSILMNQWKLLFRIADENRKRGTKASKLIPLVKKYAGDITKNSGTIN